jgi:hypothetical protein
MVRTRKVALSSINQNQYIKKYKEMRERGMAIGTTL